jgi:DNA (cytosine-5)-methyltransferase 1
MFNLSEGNEWVRRHRNFETSWLIFQPQCNHKKEKALQITSKCFISTIKNYKQHHLGPFDLASRMMGIDWMSKRELGQAIPPAYTEFIGKQLIEGLK